MTYIGEIRTFPYNYKPTMEVEWLICDGSQHPISRYQALYSIIGFRYGGDGKDVFKVPDLRTRVSAGMGIQPVTASERKIGDKWGTESVTLEMKNMPAHTHPMVGAVTTLATDLSGTPDETYKISRTYNQLDYTKRNPDAFLSEHAVSWIGGKVVNNISLAVEHENRQPVLALTYFICADRGKYPYRE